MANKSYREPAWILEEGTGSISFDSSIGLYHCRGTIRNLRTDGRDPIDADSTRFAEVEFQSDSSGELSLSWQTEQGTLSTPLFSSVRKGLRRPARYTLYSQPDWCGRIPWIRLGLPLGFEEGILGPLRLYDFDDLEPKKLQQFAQTFMLAQVTSGGDLKVSLRYNGVFLAPTETEKWIQVILRDDDGEEVLSFSKPARGNWDARWIDVDFVFPGVDRVPALDVYWVDNDTGYSVVRSLRPKEDPD